MSRYVDRLSLGMATVMRDPSARARRDILERALDLGFSRFDVAPIYGFGRAEAELGAVLGGGQPGVKVVTKFGRGLNGSGQALGRIQGVARAAVKAVPALRGLFRRSRGGVDQVSAPNWDEFRRQLESSLAALKMDQVHGYLTHEVDWSDEWSRLHDEIAANRTAIPVGFMGISSTASKLSLVAERHSRPGILQVPLDDLDIVGGVEPIGQRFAYSALSTIAARIAARRLHDPAFGELVRDVPDSASVLVPLGLLLTLQRFPKAVVIVGTTSPRHLELVASIEQYEDLAAGPVGRAVESVLFSEKHR